MEECPWEPEGVEVCLDREGQLTDRRAAAGLDLRAVYKRLVAARCLDLRVGRLGLPMWVSSAGEEAVTVAVAALAGAEDWIYPSQRDFVIAPIRGLDLDEFARHHDVISPGPSFHSRRPMLPLDRIITSRDFRLEGTGVHNTALARTGSDHLPVWAALSLVRAQAAA